MNAVHLQRRRSMLLAIAASLSLAGTAAADPTSAPPQDVLDHGRYLVQIAGCNDCHTAGYLMSEGRIPETEWLEGDRFGWRGPWGTTYATNLRLLADQLDENGWLELARNLRSRPPMPWYSLNMMHTEDLLAIYHFRRFLGLDGEPAPVGLAPEQDPAGPYARFPEAPPEQ